MILAQNILLIDDEQGIREAVKKALELRGHQVFSATNETQALAHVQTEKIHFVLSDLRLKEANGLEVLHKIRGLQPSMKSIIMTGYGSMDTAVEALRLGAVEYLIKPFKIENLIRAIENNTACAAKEDPAYSLPFAKTIPAEYKFIDQTLCELSLILELENVPRPSRATILGLFSQALHNVASHAYKTHKGQVQIELKKQAALLCGKVRDFGQGFCAQAKVLESLTQEKLGGITYLYANADDCQILTELGQGCTVNFQVALSDTTTVDSRVTLPELPFGELWRNALAQISKATSNIQINFQFLQWLSNREANDLRNSIHAAQKNKHSVAIENYYLPFPQSSDFFLKDVDSVNASISMNQRHVKQALWA